MGIQDRDWYRKDYKEREAKYGSDFNSDKKKQGSYDSTWEEVEPPHKELSKKNSPVDEDYIIVPGGCSNCQKSFQVRIKRSVAGNYSYTCPNCGRITTVRSQTQQDVGKAEHSKNLFAIAASFYGAFLALLAYNHFHFTLPIILMLIYDIWMLGYVFSKKPKAGVGTKVLAVIFFLISVGVLGLMLYFIFWKPTA